MMNSLFMDHTEYRRGVDLSKAELPIRASIGERFGFKLKDGRQYVTEGVRGKDGKREIHFRISSFIGICGEAMHYYCSVISYIHNRCLTDNSIVAGWLDGIVIPKENETLEFELSRPITQKEIDEKPSRWHGWREGDPVTAFENKQEILSLIEEIKGAFATDEWDFVIVDHS